MTLDRLQSTQYTPRIGIHRVRRGVRRARASSALPAHPVSAHGPGALRLRVAGCAARRLRARATAPRAMPSPALRGTRFDARARAAAAAAALRGRRLVVAS